MNETTPSTDDVQHEDSALETIDWANFQFPARAGVRSTKELLSGAPPKKNISRAPLWAAPPIRVDTWHLDRERWILTHPGQRKKVEILRITNKRRLSMVVDMITQQPNERDQAALWNGLNAPVYSAFGMGLAEMLAMGPDHWDWPINMQQGGQRQGGAGQAKDGVSDPEARERKRMGLNGF